MPDAHFTADLLQDKLYSIVLLKGETSQGERSYAYVAVRADCMKLFIRAQAEGDVRLSDYGNVLAEGVGEPDEDTRRYMEEMYNFNHLDVLPIKVPDSQ